MSRAAVEHAVVSTPPLCMYRHALWGASQHFIRNLPSESRAGGQLTFEGDNKGDPMYTWMGRTTKIPTAVEFFAPVIKFIMWGEKLNALLSGVAPATRQRYLSAWNRWAYFMRMRDRPVWMVKLHPNWDDDLIDLVMFEHHVMKNTSDVTRAKLPAIKFRHVVTGLDDFAKFGGRYLQVLKGMKRNHKVQRKILFSLDMVEWMYSNSPNLTSPTPRALSFIRQRYSDFSSSSGLWRLRNSACAILDLVVMIIRMTLLPFPYVTAKPTSLMKSTAKH